MISGGDPRQEEQRRRLEANFQFAQVGQCVNAVTHDINNFLGAILAYAELAELDPSLGADARRMLHKMGDAVTRCGKLINELTNLARPLRPAAGLLDLGEVARSILMLRDYAYRVQQIEPSQEIGSDVPTVLADAPQVRLAVLYLLLNAEEALADAPMKQIRVRVNRNEDGVVLSVWDSGPPIPEAVRAQMFEPFFTTKAGAHLGLGLSQAAAIATLHDGTLRYEPEEGFVLKLPLQPRHLAGL